VRDVDDLHVPNVMKSVSLNLLEPSGPHRTCYGTTLPIANTEGDVHNDTLHDLTLIKITVFRFVDTGCFLIGYFKGHTK
jgi:hypothetical protein